MWYPKNDLQMPIILFLPGKYHTKIFLVCTFSNVCIIVLHHLPFRVILLYYVIEVRVMYIFGVFTAQYS